MTALSARDCFEPHTLEQVMRQAIACHRDNRFVEAERLYTEVLKAYPQHPDANHNIGVLRVQAQRPEEALPLFLAAIEADPTASQYWLSYIEALILSGRPEDARQVLAHAREQGLQGTRVDTLTTQLAAKSVKQIAPVRTNKSARGAIKAPSQKHREKVLTLFNQGAYAESEARARTLTDRFPEHGFGWKLLGAARISLGKISTALEPMQRAAELLPQDALVLSNLAAVYAQLQRFAEAESCYRQTLVIKADFAEVHYNLGLLLAQQERLAEAAESYRSAIVIKPNYAEAHNNLGNLQKRQGQLAAAEACYRRAVQVNSGWAVAHYNLGAALVAQGQFAEAADCYRRALAINPSWAEAHNGLGIALAKQDFIEQAEECYRQALRLNPGYVEAHSNLAGALVDQCMCIEAEQSYRRALQLQPDALQHAINAHLLLPPILDGDEADAWRRRFQDGIAALGQIPGRLDDPAEKLNSVSFALAYHDRDDRPMMEALCGLFRNRVPELNATAPHCVNWRAQSRSNRRIRVGFASEYLTGHTIGKLFAGFIRHLDRNDFEVTVIHTPKSKQDPVRTEIDATADKVIALPNGLAGQQSAVAAAELDVLFYPDIGMSPTASFLAYARLAPVQLASFGHPDTTGLNTMDYFLSAKNIEPDRAPELYSERLICLNRLPCFYSPMAGLPEAAGFTALGLPDTGILYGCPQSLFKFHPDFDVVLASIAEGDPTAHIVTVAAANPAWTNKLRARWAKKYPLLLERVIFMPRMSCDRFVALLARIDVLLDPLHFGSGNTLYEAMLSGTPIVTLPGRFMRGRIVAGAYRQMKIDNAPIASDIESYVRLALELGSDRNRRSDLRHRLAAAARQYLFADVQAVRELESFIRSAVAAASSGELLPADWSPCDTSRGIA